MILLKSRTALSEWRKGLKSLPSSSLGFVPTMGALHHGHATLISMSAKVNSQTLVSIFVNPTQFNNPDDLKKYPRTHDEDLAIAKSAGATAVFLPEYSDLYPDSYRYKLTESEESKVLCGQFRPGHFDGVLTVVLRLFQLAQPNRAYFGEKDYQQLRLIKGMCEAFFLDLEVVPCPTVREADGLALSSRNRRLNENERQIAPHLYRVLKSQKSHTDAIEELTALGFRVEYLEEKWGRRLVAAFLGEIRLIDNVEVS